MPLHVAVAPAADHVGPVEPIGHRGAGCPAAGLGPLEEGGPEPRPAAIRADPDRHHVADQPAITFATIHRRRAGEGRVLLDDHGIERRVETGRRRPVVLEDLGARDPVDLVVEMARADELRRRSPVASRIEGAEGRRDRPGGGVHRSEPYFIAIPRSTPRINAVQRRRSAFRATALPASPARWASRSSFR